MTRLAGPIQIVFVTERFRVLSIFGELLQDGVTAAEEHFVWSLTIESWTTHGGMTA